MTSTRPESSNGPADDPSGSDSSGRAEGVGRHDTHPALDLAPPAEARSFRSAIDPVVFGVTAAIAVAFLVWGFASTESLADTASTAISWIVTNLGWLFVLASSAFVVFVIWLALSRYGNIPLGRDGEVPEFRTVSWIAMMFSAGMGIGLMFFGVAEPVFHYVDGTPGEPAEDTKVALATTMFHWGLHPWAIYAVLGLAIAYGVFRKGRLQLVSAAFESLLGRHANGPIGKLIDILAIFATLFGSAASLGLGALQIRSGLDIVGGFGEFGNGMLIVIIAVLTAAFIVSAVSGIARGIQWLANTNMVLALILALFVFVAGPTVLILDTLPSTIAAYSGSLAELSGRLPSDVAETPGGTSSSDWLSGYTVFYWAWWLSWTPFVGMFIARISRGRTIRQFVAGVLLVPTLVSLVWFSIFGSAGIDLTNKGNDIYGDGNSESMLFNVLEQYPLATVMSILVMVLVAIFFVSGADAASIVMGTLSEHGSIEPRRANVIFWGAATGAVAAVMLLVGGEDALSGLQNITIAASVPFVLVMIALCFAFMRDLRQDPIAVRRVYAEQAVEKAVVTGVSEHGDDFALSVEGTEPGGGISNTSESPAVKPSANGTHGDAATGADGSGPERA